MAEANYKNDGLINQEQEYSQTQIYILTALLSFILFVSLTGQGIIIPVFPLYKFINGSTFQLGLLISVFSLFGLIFSPFIGSWADRYGRKIFILLGLLGFAVANLLYATAQNLDQLVIYRIIEGATGVGTSAIVNALLVDIVPQNKRGRYLGFANGAGFVGVFVGPFLGGLLVQYGGIALPFVVSASVALIGLVFAYFLLPNDYSKFHLRHLAKKETQKLSLVERVDFRKWLIKGASFVFVIVILIRLAGLMAWTIIQPVVSIYLYKLKFSPLQVGIFFSCYGLTMFIGQIFLGGLSDKYGRKKILQLGLIIYFCGYLVIINTTNIYRFYFAGFLNGVGLSLVVPSIVALLADLTNDISHRGKVMAVYYDAFYFAGFIGPLFGGYIGDIVPFEFVLNMSIVIILIGIALSFLIKNLRHNDTSVTTDGEIMSKPFTNSKTVIEGD